MLPHQCLIGKIRSEPAAANSDLPEGHGEFRNSDSVVEQIRQCAIPYLLNAGFAHFIAVIRQESSPRSNLILEPCNKSLRGSAPGDVQG
jgi:hypothetical protein